MSDTIKQPQHADGLDGGATSVSQSYGANLQTITASIVATRASTAAAFWVALWN